MDLPKRIVLGHLAVDSNKAVCEVGRRSHVYGCVCVQQAIGALGDSVYLGLSSMVNIICIRESRAKR